MNSLKDCKSFYESTKLIKRALVKAEQQYSGDVSAVRNYYKRYVERLDRAVSRLEKLFPRENLTQEWELIEIMEELREIHEQIKYS